MRAAWPLVALLLLFGCGVAEQPPAAAQAWTDPGYVTQGPWVLHYSALLATDLDPAIARSYAVEIKQNRVILSVDVQRASDGASVPADIAVVARTLLGTPQNVALRQVATAHGSFAIGTLDVSHRETFVFEVTARPRDSAESIAARWQRTFYLD